ncbi:16S rRNA (uracil(1498)-N(3))-methyltransferase [Pseudothermotoga sp. U03pept]|uniref:16S rRNA (uracil(1498)-N(3))-methyltransferase n=1 Tax=Pseudothermotoga sp. U03pept TaxID=3447012 RepID=UPI003F0E2661
MPHLFYGKPAGESVELDEHETHHLKVVRAIVGQQLLITDGDGNLYECELIEVGKNRSRATIKQSKLIERREEDVILCVASENWDRLRLLVEKAVEIGVDKVVVYKSRRSRSYLQKEDKLKLVIRDSAKQAARYLFPQLEIRESLDFLDEEFRTIVLHQSGRPAVIGDFAGKIRIVVGPEGDFTEEEIELLKKRGEFLSLGRKILRFETAAIIVAGMATFLNLKI